MHINFLQVLSFTTLQSLMSSSRSMAALVQPGITFLGPLKASKCRRPNPQCSLAATTDSNHAEASIRSQSGLMACFSGRSQPATSIRWHQHSVQQQGSKTPHRIRDVKVGALAGASDDSGAQASAASADVASAGAFAYAFYKFTR